MGAMALFGEKYGDRVRVVSVGDWAHELCGGTHAQRSGQLGVVTFLSEGSIGAGVRRVEALVGSDAYQFLAREHVLVGRLTELVKAPADQLVERIEQTIASLKAAEKDLAKVRSAALTIEPRRHHRRGPRHRPGAPVGLRRARGHVGQRPARAALEGQGPRPGPTSRSPSWAPPSPTARWRSSRRVRRGHRAGCHREGHARRRPRRSSTVAAAARTRSPRAAAPTPTASRRPSPLSRP